MRMNEGREEGKKEGGMWKGRRDLDDPFCDRKRRKSREEREEHKEEKIIKGRTKFTRRWKETGESGACEREKERDKEYGG